MKKLYFFIVTLLVCFSAKAQIVNIPDVNFKNALVNTPCVTNANGPEVGDADTNDDGEIQLSEAAAVQLLDISNQGIASLEGIDAFTGLMRLNCSQNQLTELTVTSSPSLVNLDCSHNLLTSLTTNFTTDNFVAMEYETSLNCSYNALTSLTLPAVPFYGTVDCSHNELTQIAILPGGSIYGLALGWNAFTSFDAPVSAEILSLNNCPITTCKVITGQNAVIINNPLLISAEIGSSGTYEIHDNPQLQSIDLKDGFVGYVNGDLSDPHFNFTGNPALQFVCLDDLGNWYEEGGPPFLISETDLVQVDPGVSKTFYCTMTPGGGYNTLSGQVHFDCGGANLDAQGVKLNIAQGTSGGEAFTSADGNYTYYAAATGTATIAPQPEHPYFTVSPPSYSFDFTGAGNTQTADFCLTANGVHPDLGISMVSVLRARPGFDAIYKIVCRNNGTETQSGTVSLAFDDSRLDFVSASPTQSQLSTGTISWNFSGLAPFESREFTFTVNVNSAMEIPAVNIGDSLDFTASADAGSEETPADNVFALQQTVIGSLDPNDKAVSRENIGVSQLDDDLYYTIRFQNTGTAAAENVVVRDLLSDKLDLATLQIVSASHPYRSSLTQANKLEFFFEGIDLPAAGSNEPESHGYVTFRIKPKNTIILGDVVENTANIYFDYNFPVTTNTVTTTVTALGTSHFSPEDSVALYPNPANQTVTIEMPDDRPVKNISVFNLLGQLVKEIPPAFDGNSMTADISALNTGTYLISIVSDKGKTSKKLIKL